MEITLSKYIVEGKSPENTFRMIDFVIELSTLLQIIQVEIAGQEIRAETSYE